METHDKIRVRELTDFGDWPWRFIVEGRRKAFWRKRWPWSREATVLVPATWEQLPHRRRGLSPCQASDAAALAHHYRTAALSPETER